jgi:hypothetical protein
MRVEPAVGVLDRCGEDPCRVACDDEAVPLDLGTEALFGEAAIVAGSGVEAQLRCQLLFSPPFTFASHPARARGARYALVLALLLTCGRAESMR